LTSGQISLLTRSVASKVRAAVKAATPKHTGETRKSWTPVRKTEGGYSFLSDTVQTYFLEYGSKRGKRPWPTATGVRTVYNQGRVYSSQAPEGITAKAKVDEIAQEIAEQVFLKVMAEK
jgi:hypothetical protein